MANSQEIERAELIDSMQTLAKTHMALSTGSDLEERTANVLRQAAALLAADDKAGVEVVAQVVSDPDGRNKRVIFHSNKALWETPLWTYLYTRPQPQAERPAERVAIPMVDERTQNGAIDEAVDAACGITAKDQSS